MSIPPQLGGSAPSFMWRPTSGERSSRYSPPVNKRILQLIPSFNSGGSERQAAAITSRLIEEGSFEIMAATLNKEGVLLPDFLKTYSSDMPEYKLSSFYDRNFVHQVRQFA